MNNTMKNLKDEIEEIDSQVAKLEGVYLYETGKGIGAGSEGWYVKGDEVVALVTSLIEQEKERAVREFLEQVRFTQDPRPLYAWTDWRHLKEDMEQYLAERKGE